MDTQKELASSCLLATGSTNPARQGPQLPARPAQPPRLKRAAQLVADTAAEHSATLAAEEADDSTLLRDATLLLSAPRTIAVSSLSLLDAVPLDTATCACAEAEAPTSSNASTYTATVSRAGAAAAAEARPGGSSTSLRDSTGALLASGSRFCERGST
jgi:hypothetical protein